MKTKQMQVPAHLVARVNEMIERDKPAKPIKRVEKFSVKEQAMLMQHLKAAVPLFKKAEKEFDTSCDRYEYERMTASDQKWYDGYMGRLGSVFDYMNKNLDSSFF